RWRPSRSVKRAPRNAAVESALSPFRDFRRARMRRGRLLAIGLLGVGTWLVMPAAHAGETTLKANMTGAEEVPGPGAPNGKGTATVVFDDAKNTACYEITYENIGKP